MTLIYQIIVLACTYFLTGQLSSFLGVVPDFGTLIWIPSGVALAALLLYGNRLWLGVLIGAFAANMMFGVQLSMPLDAMLIISTGMTAIGATLQAMIGVVLLKKYADFPNPLASQKQILAFILFGGVGSSLINCTLSVITLLLTQKLMLEAFLTNWLRWWLGDALGIIVFTPLIFIWLFKEQPYFEDRKLAITVNTGLIFIVSMGVIFYEHINLKKQRDLQLDKEANVIVKKIEDDLAQHLLVLKSLGNFYASSQVITRQEFKIFANNLMRDFKIESLRFDKVVLDKERAAFEKGQRKEGITNFTITELDKNNQLTTAQKREYYVSAMYVEPMPYAEKLLGYDSSSEKRQQGIADAQEAGELVLTTVMSPFWQLNAPEKNAMIAYVPVYQKGSTDEMPEQHKQHNIYGYYTAVFDLETLVNHLFLNQGLEHLFIRLSMIDARGAKQQLFHTRGLAIDDLEKALISESTVMIGGQQWVFEVYVSKHYERHQNLLSFWLIAFFGLMMTSMLCYGSLMLTGRKRFLQQLLMKHSDELLESERKYYSTFDNAPIGVAMVAMDGYFIDANKSFCELVDFTRDDLLTKQFTESFSLAHKNKDAKGLMEEVMAMCPPQFQIETHYLQKSGRAIWLRILVKLITRNAHYGVDDKFIILIENIDWSIKALELVRETEVRFRTIANAAPVKIWMSGTDTLFYWFNERWLEFTGKSLETQIGNGWMDGIHPDDFMNCLDSYIVNFQNRQAFQQEFRLKHHSGDYRWVLSSGLPVFNGKNEFEGYIGSCVEIDHLKSLQSEREQLLSIIDESPSFIGVANRASQVLYINTAGKRMVGLAMDVDISTLKIADFHPENALQRLRNEYLPTAIKEGFWRGESELKHQNGTSIPVSQVISVHHDGAILSTVMSDISETKNAAKTLLEAKNAAEALSKSKMDFLANMSHEIRTPMNAIIGLAQLGVLAEPYKQTEYLSKILGASENLLVIVNDILEFSKIEADGIQLVKDYFSLGRLVENLSNVFEESARQKVLQFKLNLSSDVTRHLIGDEVRLQQVLINLLNNSLKFTHEGSVSLDVTLVSKDDYSITLRFAINDTGIGINQEQQRTLFKAFQQADSSISRRFGGTGLGLAISQQLVGLMGGEIHCDSEEGKGSCFWFELMFDLPSVQATEAFKQHAYRHRPLQEQLKDYSEKLAGVTALLVEDLPLNQQVASEFLQNTGLLVSIANNGEEALQLLEKRLFDVVLMDIQMPVMNGLEATAHIRKNPAWAHLPVIAMSAGVTLDEQTQCQQVGIDDFIAKPINPLQMLEIIAAVLKR